MRHLALCLATALVFATGAVAASGDMAVTSSSYVAGARGVRLTVVLHYEIQCGYPGATPVELTLPGHVPATVRTSTVLVDGKPTRSVTVHGHQLTIAMPPPREVMCDSITMGRLTLVLTAGAGVANPTAAGSYSVHASKGSLQFAARLAIR